MLCFKSLHPPAPETALRTVGAQLCTTADASTAVGSAIKVTAPSEIRERRAHRKAAFVESVWRTHPHVKIRVNLDPGVVACHEPERIYRGIDRVLQIVGDRTNCVMGTGALPLETPPENIRLIRNYVAN